MELVICLLIICAIIPTVFGLLIYSRIDELCRDVDWEQSFSSEMMNQLKSTQFDLEELKRKEEKEWRSRRI